MCEGAEGLGQNLMLAALLNSFPNDFVALHALPLTQLITSCPYSGENSSLWEDQCLNYSIMKCCLALFFQPRSKRALRLVYW